MESNNSSESVTIRTHRPGDLGYIVHRHGAIYAETLGWVDERFEGIVAKIASDFLAGHDDCRERCWIAEKDEQFAGCIMLVRDEDSPNTAKLRCFLVEPAVRGLGVGKRLLRLCVDFAKAAGYTDIKLRTESSLKGARRMYAQEGFAIVERWEHRTWGFDETGETWAMSLQ